MFEYVKKRLNTLKRDINFSNSRMDAKIKFYEGMKNNIEFLKEDYVRDFAPIKVSNLELAPQCDVDMNSIFIDFSEGYENFKKVLDSEIAHQKYIRDSSKILLNNILKLRSPLNEILFMKYYLNMNQNVIKKFFYYSKSGYYRTLSKGTEELYNLIMNSEDKKYFTEQHKTDYLKYSNVSEHKKNKKTRAKKG